MKKARITKLSSNIKYAVTQFLSEHDYLEYMARKAQPETEHDYHAVTIKVYSTFDERVESYTFVEHAQMVTITDGRGVMIGGYLNSENTRRDAITWR